MTCVVHDNHTAEMLLIFFPVLLNLHSLPYIFKANKLFNIFSLIIIIKAELRHDKSNTSIC